MQFTFVFSMKSVPLNGKCQKMGAMDEGEGVSKDVHPTSIRPTLLSEVQGQLQ